MTASVSAPESLLGRALSLAPGFTLCLALTAVAVGLQRLEVSLFGRAWLESLVIAILLGAVVRTFWTPGPIWKPGIDICAKLLLEIAVVLLGGTVSGAMIASVGAPLLFGIFATVAIAIAISYGSGRAFGLPHRMSTLIACGNSICGNSAIAAVAPVIGANSKDVASAIAFTAVLGVIVVLILPLLAAALHMTPYDFGVFAGLTVYAVPQVLAATAPISSYSAQVGTLVKLVRVLTLGPVVVILSILARRDRDSAGSGKPLAIHTLVPWFVVGFLILVVARSTGAVPLALISPMAATATWLTIIAMAALGLGVDVRAVAQAGLRVTAVVTLSLLALALIAWLLIGALALAR